MVFEESIENIIDRLKNLKDQGLNPISMGKIPRNCFKKYKPCKGNDCQNASNICFLTFLIFASGRGKSFYSQCFFSEKRIFSLPDARRENVKKQIAFSTLNPLWKITYRWYTLTDLDSITPKVPMGIFELVCDLRT